MNQNDTKIFQNVFDDSISKSSQLNFSKQLDFTCFFSIQKNFVKKRGQNIPPPTKFFRWPIIRRKLVENFLEDSLRSFWSPYWILIPKNTFKLEFETPQKWKNPKNSVFGGKNIPPPKTHFDKKSLKWKVFNFSARRAVSFSKPPKIFS